MTSWTSVERSDKKCGNSGIPDNATCRSGGGGAMKTKKKRPNGLAHLATVGAGLGAAALGGYALTHMGKGKDYRNKKIAGSNQKSLPGRRPALPGRSDASPWAFGFEP